MCMFMFVNVEKLNRQNNIPLHRRSVNSESSTNEHSPHTNIVPNRNWKSKEPTTNPKPNRRGIFNKLARKSGDSVWFSRFVCEFHFNVDSED